MMRMINLAFGVEGLVTDIEREDNAPNEAEADSRRRDKKYGICDTEYWDVLVLSRRLARIRGSRVWKHPSSELSLLTSSIQVLLTTVHTHTHDLLITIASWHAAMAHSIHFTRSCEIIRSHTISPPALPSAHKPRGPAAALEIGRDDARGPYRNSFLLSQKLKKHHSTRHVRVERDETPGSSHDLQAL